MDDALSLTDAELDSFINSYAAQCNTTESTEFNFEELLSLL